MSLRTPAELLGVFALALCLSNPPVQAQEGHQDPGHQDIWVSAYFASWTHAVGAGGGHVRTEDVDWDSFTEMNYFALVPQADGTFCCTGEQENMSPQRLAEIVPAAHAHDKPILVSVGGWGTYDGFRAAIRAPSRATLVQNIVDFVEEWGFDGVDVDMEPIHPEDRSDFVAFVRELRAALDPIPTPMLERPRLTAAVQWEASMFAELADVFDQINIMTYDMAGTFGDGWVTWHNATLENGGQTFPSHGGPLPSPMNEVTRFREAGVPAKQLGIGIDFYGYTWRGGRRSDDPTQGTTAPRQAWVPGAAPEVTDNVPFHELARRFELRGDGSSSPFYRWDDAAGAAYLSVDRANPDEDIFVSYEDARAIREKIERVRREGLGGVILWEIGGGLRSDAEPSERNVLLHAVGAALRDGQRQPDRESASSPPTAEAGDDMQDAPEPSTAPPSAPAAGDGRGTEPAGGSLDGASGGCSASSASARSLPALAGFPLVFACVFKARRSRARGRPRPRV